MNIRTPLALALVVPQPQPTSSRSRPGDGGRHGRELLRRDEGAADAAAFAGASEDTPEQRAYGRVGQGV